MYEALNPESSDESFNLISGNFSVPYSGKLPQIKIGSEIKICGKTNKNSKRFAINLMCNKIICNNIALHFNPRFTEGFAVRNSRVDNNWLDEEREPYYLPFQKNENFSIVFSVNQESYKIFINGVYFVGFKHRLPYSEVNGIEIDGDVKISSIDYEIDPKHCIILGQSIKINAMFDPKLPFIQSIPNGLRPGMVIGIVGRPVSNARKIDINLIQKINLNSDIALHLSIRFGKDSKHSSVVRNSRFAGEWGEEEKYCTDFPFIIEKMFDLRIIVENNRFIIIINGKNFCDFSNRLYPLSNSNQIEVYGDLNLFLVRF